MTVQRKALAQRHGLLGILTGQVVWNLVEDAGATPDEVERFMDWYFTWREDLLDVLERISDTPTACVQLHVCNDAAACDACSALDGTLLSASIPDLIEKLPPFAIGCRCLPRILTEVPEGAQCLHEIPMPLPSPRPCCRTLPITSMLHLYQMHGRFWPA